MFKKVFNKSREKFYKNRVKFGRLKKMHLRLEKPKWMEDMSDPLEEVYMDQEKLIYEGRVALSALIQANNFLFDKHNPYNCPAEFLFTEDEYYLDNPQELIDIATHLYSLKGTEDNGEIQEFISAITDECIRLLNTKLPLSITGGRIVYHTSLIVDRRHIPNRHLDRRLYPIFIYPELTRASTLMPYKMWGRQLLLASKKYK